MSVYEVRRLKAWKARVDEDDSPISPDQPPAASSFPGPETGTYIEAD